MTILTRALEGKIQSLETELRQLRVENRGLKSKRDNLKTLLHQATGQIVLLTKRLKEATNRDT